ncbi:pseudouridine synthase PUS6 [Lachancea thermotolerans CBS 6340]|uniref:KLTH0B02376p n=1 Tax=Lachancea thermotolerans (strain ATCC 56472 / CBS 6340 / NRRL Y-8284) TaxID=559295 RepID=C5DCE4_LACTC|nr:KLTH0B02376p [Lachancea thermotolerans CBS 6340]CAR21455.1 KLTH0B02376p [Lachancea thermotolerans CBS 6340]
MMGAEVYFANGLRKIKPYHHSRLSFAKGRWLDRTLLDVLSDEFRANTKEEYEKGILQKKFQIIRDGAELSVEEVLKGQIRNKDVIRTTSHKHEPPVRQWAKEENSGLGWVAGMKVVHECEDLLVIDKPSGIPIHPTGQYYQNTLVEVLKSHGKTVFPSHRLDKITSGVLILTKNPHMANKIQHQIRQRTMSKIYLARVDGAFPMADTLGSLTPFESPDKTQTVDSAIYTVELKKQFPAAFSPPREAKTKFYPLKYYPKSDETLVACQPITGRTHQIRIHLARLGHPIVNDPFYNLKNSRYPKRLTFMLECHNWNKQANKSPSLSELFEEFLGEAEKLQRSERSALTLEKCPECDASIYPDPTCEELQLFLHAWKYTDDSGSLKFETEIPKWAKSGWT